ncbi:pyridoxamine 5'-phosphate oxidase family protein [bacterium]|nr:pyridoxamine 5'-phosphate oxidase family protein [bacterium]
MNFNNEVQEVLNQYSLAYIATATSDGTPNVSPKGIVKYDADQGTICFLDLFCKNTRKNLETNPKLALAIIDYKNFRGFQFKGSTEMISSGPEFEQAKLDWHLIKHNRFQDRVRKNISRLVKDPTSEYNMPEPKYLVKLHVEKIINLASFEEK